MKIFIVFTVTKLFIKYIILLNHQFLTLLFTDLYIFNIFKQNVFWSISYKMEENYELMLEEAINKFTVRFYKVLFRFWKTYHNRNMNNKFIDIFSFQGNCGDENRWKFNHVTYFSSNCFGFVIVGSSRKNLRRAECFFALTELRFCM